MRGREVDSPPRSLPECYSYEMKNREHFTSSLPVKTASASLLFVAFVFPALAFAYPFGGQATEVHQCYNQTIYVVLRNLAVPSQGGILVWTPQTLSYAFGPPSHAGQWLLGLAGAPYICLYTIEPIDVRAADTIIMHGSSQ